MRFTRGVVVGKNVNFCQTLLTQAKRSINFFKFCQIGKCQMAFFGITVDFIIQKLKSKQLVFSGDRFFEGMSEIILQIFRA